MNREEINARLEELRGGIAYLAEFDELDADQRSQWDEGTAEFEALSARAADIAERTAAADRAAKVPTIQFITRPDTADVAADRSSTPQQLADSVARSLEDQGVSAEGQDQARRIALRHKSDTGWVRSLAARSTPVYADAFMKIITGGDIALSNEERAAAAVGTNTAGGYLVPTHLDPTLIITNSGSSNAIRGISRVETLVGANVWNGVQSAGVTASWDGELVEVSDDTPALVATSVPIYKAQAFVQASVEALEDIASLQSQLLAMFADARDRLEATAHATGSGSGQPTGIFTALDANTNVELTSATAATLALADLSTTYRSVPVRFRANGKWLMNPLYLGAIQALGTAMSASYSTDLTEAWTSRILGKPVIESDEAPTTQTTTVRDNEIIYGDFSNFLIVDKPGSFSVQYVPTMFNTANNLPDGRVGWHAWWRTGSDSINDVSFRLLQDKTSA